MKGSRAVTLIEVLITVIIISILAVSIYVSVGSSIELSRDARLKEMAVSASKAMQTAGVIRPTGVTSWNSNGLADPSYWELYTEPGDVERMKKYKSKFGYLSGDGTDPWAGPLNGHPGQSGGPPALPYSAGYLPGKLYLWDDLSAIATIPSGTQINQGLPYQP